MKRDNNEKIRLSKKYQEWKGLKISGDIGEIAEKAGVSTVTVSKAVNNGIGSLRILKVVDEFYCIRKKIS